VRSIVGSFLASAPDARALLATNSLETPVLGLVSQQGAEGFALDRLQDGALAERLHALGLDDPLAVLGSFIAGPQALRRFAAGAPLNSDDFPIVAQRAPFATYAPGSSSRQRLAKLLRALDVEPREVLSARALRSEAEAARLAAYWRARDRFIELGLRVQPAADAAAWIEQLRAPLLAILRESPDFRPAYDPLLEMATALQRSDAGDARVLLAEIEAARSAGAVH
jgi:spermidine synthase